MDQAAGRVDTELYGAQHQEVGEVEVCGRRDVGSRVGEHGLVEPEEGIEKPQLRCRVRITHPPILAACNY